MSHDPPTLTQVPGTPVMSVAGLVDYQAGGIVSRQVVKKAVGNVTIFAFEEGQELTEHTSPFDALLHVVEGEAEITIGGRPSRVRSGEMVILPADVPHAVKAAMGFKMILTMIRN